MYLALHVKCETNANMTDNPTKACNGDHYTAVVNHDT